MPIRRDRRPPAPGPVVGSPPSRAEQFEAQVRATRAQLDAMEERIQARTGRNLPLAILIGLVFGAIVVVSLVLVKALFIVVGALLVAFVVFELTSALRFAGRDVPRWPSVVAGVLAMPVAFVAGAPGLWYAVLGAIALVVLWRLVAQLVRRGRGTARELVDDLGAIAFVQVYVTLLGGLAVVLTAEEGGERWTLALLIVVVVSDTFAYVTGLLLGRRKMSPRISPGKTWEGFGGSLVFGLAAGLLVAPLLLGAPVWQGAVLGVALVLTATLGDLTESLIKRGLGIKDISTWLPGHGGFLDRIDSTLTSAPVAFLLFLLFT